MNASTLLFTALPIAALTVSLIATRWLASHPGSRLGRLDHPNARSLHSTPVPRTGGLGLLAGILIALLIADVMGAVPVELGWIVAALALVAGVSFVDDLGHLSPLVRMAVHILAAIVLILGGLSWGDIDLSGSLTSLPFMLGAGLTLLFVVWMINLYNFMDGMDGLASGMAIIGFSALASLGWLGGAPIYAGAALCVAGASAGFLTVNFPPARIFLGDSGASSLGLLAAAFSLWGAQSGLFPLWTAGLIFSPFIVDATWTLLMRLARRERFWEAHRSHHYQRLVLAGWSHRKTLLYGYLIMVAAAACAVASPRLIEHEQWMLLGAWVIIYILIHFKVALIERQRATH